MTKPCAENNTEVLPSKANSSTEETAEAKKNKRERKVNGRRIGKKEKKELRLENHQGERKEPEA